MKVAVPMMSDGIKSHANSPASCCNMHSSAGTFAQLSEHICTAQRAHLHSLTEQFLCSITRYLHLDSCPRAPVQAPPDGVSQSSVLDGSKGNSIARVCDGMHLLNESQGREGGVAMNHLVQNAAQTPYI